jgi:MFS family permease
MLVGNGLLRIANAGSGALVGFYLAALARQGARVDAALVGTLGAVASGAELLAALPLGVLVDRYASRLLLVSGALLGASAPQLFGLTRLAAIFFLSRALEGLAAASSTSPLLAYLADVSRSDKAARGRVMSFYEMSLLAGLALGALVGGTLWEAVQTRAFSLLALVYVLVGVLFWWGACVPYRPQALPYPLAGLKHALADPLLRRLAPAWLAVTAILGMWLTQSAFQLSGPKAAGQYLVGRFTPGEVGMVMLVYALVFAAGVTVWGYALARVPRLRALKITLVATLIACLWLFLLNRSAEMPEWVRGVLLALAALAVMVESGFTPAALAFLADVADQGKGRGATMGLYSLLLGLGSVLGALVGGLLAHWADFDGLLLGTIALGVVALITVMRLHPPSERLR